MAPDSISWMAEGEQTRVLSRFTGSMVSFRRYRWWLLSLFVLSGLASWFLWSNAAGHVMRERYERIQIGMTPAEVREIVGSEDTEQARKLADSEQWVTVFLYLSAGAGVPDKSLNWSAGRFHLVI